MDRSTFKVGCQTQGFSSIDHENFRVTLIARTRSTTLLVHNYCFFTWMNKFCNDDWSTKSQLGNSSSSSSSSPPFQSGRECGGNTWFLNLSCHLNLSSWWNNLAMLLHQQNLFIRFINKALSFLPLSPSLLPTNSEATLPIRKELEKRSKGMKQNDDETDF